FKCSVLSCDLFINAFPASVSMPATVAVIYDAELGRNVVDVVMGELTFTHGLTEGHIQTASSNCLITSVADALDQSGFSLIEFMWQFAEPVLQLYLEGAVKPDLEAQLEQVLSVAYY